jgi:hypothetical protein
VVLANALGVVALLAILSWLALLIDRRLARGVDVSAASAPSS